MNKWIGAGRLTKDPDVRYSGDTCIARYTLAIDRDYKKDGEQSADFINCVAFGKSAEFAEKYLRQGTKMIVEGRIQTGSYTDKDGKKVYTTDVILEKQEFAESKKTSQESEQQTEQQDFMNIPEGLEDDLPFNQPTR